MVDEVFSREHKVANQEIWSKDSELTDEQRNCPIVGDWFVHSGSKVAGELDAVNRLDGTTGIFTEGVVKKQGLQLGDVVIVREGKTRDKDTVTLIKGNGRA